MRLLTGSVYGIYFATWTHGWSGGAFPEHVVALDVTLTLAIVAAAWLLRLRLPLVPLAATHLHHGVALGILALPTTPLAWGAVLVSTGFAMLVALLAHSYRWQRQSSAAEVPSAPQSRSEWSGPPAPE